MRKQILLSVSVLLAVSIFSIPSAWAQGQHQCQVAGEGEHQCVQSDEATQQCVYSENIQQAENDKGSAALKKALDNYFVILSSLSQNSMENVQANAKNLAETTSKLAEHCADSTGGCGKSCRPGLLADASAAAKALADKNDISAARSEFGVLSEKLVEFLNNVSEGKSGNLHVFKCDMAKKVWLQENEDPGNPYFGPSMAKCRRKIN